MEKLNKQIKKQIEIAQMSQKPQQQTISNNFPVIEDPKPEVYLKGNSLYVQKPDGNYLIYNYDKLKEKFQGRDPRKMSPREVFDVLYGKDSEYNPYSGNYRWGSNNSGYETGEFNLNACLLGKRDITITDPQAGDDYVITLNNDGSGVYNITQFSDGFTSQGTRTETNYGRIVITPTPSGRSWNVSLVALVNRTKKEKPPDELWSCKYISEPTIIEDSAKAAFALTGGTCITITTIWPTLGEEIACFPIACAGGLVGMAASSVIWVYSVFDCGSKRRK